MPVCVCQCVCVCAHMLACMREHTCMPRVHTGVKGHAHHLPAAIGQRPITFVANVATRPKIGGFAGRRCSRYFQIYDACDTRSTALRSCQHTLGSANYWSFYARNQGVEIVLVKLTFFCSHFPIYDRAPRIAFILKLLRLFTVIMEAIKQLSKIKNSLNIRSTLVCVCVWGGVESCRSFNEFHIFYF